MVGDDDSQSGKDLPSLTEEEKAMLDAMHNRSIAKKKPAAAVQKKPAAAGSGPAIKKTKAEIPTYTRKQKLKIPVAHGSLNYRGGRIYTIWGQRKFRAIKDINVPSKEKVVKWSKAKPSSDEWAVTVKSVDEYWDK